jgi:hypothetical protein
VGVGGVVREFFEWAFVWGDVDPHGGGLGACEPDGHRFTREHLDFRVCVLLLQDLLQSCARGGRRRVEDMCYERRRAEACVDESAHHALVNAGGREIV